MKKFQIIACLIIILLLASSLVACSPTDKYVVTIHPNNGGANIQWNINEKLPTFEKTGFEIEGYYLDSDFTISINPATLKVTGLTADIDIYVKWKAVEACNHIWGSWVYNSDGLTHTRVCTLDSTHTETEAHINLDEDEFCDRCNAKLNNSDWTASAEFEVPEGGYDGSEVTITFYHTMGGNLTTVLDWHIPEFRSMYPNINVEHYQVGSYDDVKGTISSAIATGDETPNIAYCYPDHVSLYNTSNAVVQLDDLIASTETVTRQDGTTEILGLTQAQKEDYIGDLYSTGSAFGDGHMYSLPFSKSTDVLYYNATFFEEHGLQVPTTWDEMEALCAQIKAIDPDCIPLGYDSEANLFINLCAQLGSPYTSAEDGGQFLFDNATNQAFVKRLREWYQKGYIITQTLYGGYTSGLFTATSGTKCYMTIASSAGATHQRPNKIGNAYLFEVGIAPIPQVDPENPKVVSQGPDLCIFSKENPQEVIASWLFVKYLTTCPEFQIEFSMASGYIPVLKSVMNYSFYTNWLSHADGGTYIAALSAKVCLEQEDAYFVSPAFNGSSIARKEVGLLLCNALSFSPNSGETVEEMINRLFKNAIAECEDLS